MFARHLIIASVKDVGGSRNRRFSVAQVKNGLSSMQGPGRKTGYSYQAHEVAACVA